MNNDKCWCKLKTRKKKNTCGKDYLWNSSACSCENGGYLESIIDKSVITSNKIIGDADSVSTNVCCSVPMNAANIASINFDGKAIRYKMDCYILHNILLVVILLFIIVIICYH